MTTTGPRRLAALTVALALGGAGTAAAQAPPPVQEPEGLLRWMADHPRDAGLVVLSDRGARLVSHGATGRFPLASTRKVLVVGALTASGASLDTRVPRASVERFYVPGTDGGAHERARLDPRRPTLRQLARATLEVSDNAAADALLARVGPRLVDGWARSQGMRRQDPIFPLLGEFAAWTRDPRWSERSPAGRARRAIDLARRVQPEAVTVPPVADQRRLAAASVAGAPGEWAALMRRIGRAGDPRLVSLLDWPRRRSAPVRRALARYLTKGGSLPGVLTEASYVRRRGRPGMAVALFLRDLPADVEATLKRTFTHQGVILRLATDRAFRARARALLRDGRR